MADSEDRLQDRGAEVVHHMQDIAGVIECGDWVVSEGGVEICVVGRCCRDPDGADTYSARGEDVVEVTPERFVEFLNKPIPVTPNNRDIPFFWMGIRDRCILLDAHTPWLLCVCRHRQIFAYVCTKYDVFFDSEWAF